jgi:23S rRNA (cytosine1962-C5)-methyltransferase
MPTQSRPTIRLRPGAGRRLRHGHPWIFANEVEMDADARRIDPGTAVVVREASGRPLGVAHFNPHTLIAARLLDADPDAIPDTAFFAARIARAGALRNALDCERFCRLVHGEADGLPGLVIDRYGDVAVVQPNTAGMDRCLPEIRAALDATIVPRTVIVRRDMPVRTLEGLDAAAPETSGASLDGPVPVEENGLSYRADLADGQKTGWFFDQRESRAFMAGLARGRRVLDVYSYTGGFALLAAHAGATDVEAVDRSADALALARAAADANGVAARCAFTREDAFRRLEVLVAAGDRRDVVICDPPAFVKSRKHLATGRRGYRKLATLAAQAVAPGGFLFIASCSHLVTPDVFAGEVARGVERAGRTGRIVRTAGAGPDHPIHPALPETAYLKALVYALD